MLCVFVLVYLCSVLAVFALTVHNIFQEIVGRIPYSHCQWKKTGQYCTIKIFQQNLALQLFISINVLLLCLI